MTASHHPPILTPRQVEWRYLVLSGLQWLPVGLVVPVLVLLLRARGIELPVIGTLFAVYTVVVIALELPTGSLADVLGRRRTLILSRVLSVVALVGMAVAADPLQFAVVMALSGVARALQSGPLEAWYVDTVHATDPDADVRRGISRAWSLEAIGLAVGAVIGGFLPSLATGLSPEAAIVPMSIPYVASAALTVVGLVAVVLLMTDGPTGPRPAVGRVIRDVPATVAAGLRLAAGDRTIRLVLGATAGFGFALSALEVVSPVQFASLLGGEERASGAYGVLVTLAFIGTASGSAVAPRIAARLRSGPRAAALVTFIMALAFAGMATGNSFVLVALLYVAVYLCAGIAGPLNNDTLHYRVDGAQRATLLSVVSLAQMSGGLVGNLLVPVLAAISFGLGWLAAAGVVLVGATLLALLPRTVGRRDPVEPVEPAGAVTSAR
jgi:MFS family permease